LVLAVGIVGLGVGLLGSLVPIAAALIVLGALTFGIASVIAIAGEVETARKPKGSGDSRRWILRGSIRALDMHRWSQRGEISVASASAEDAAETSGTRSRPANMAASRHIVDHRSSFSPRPTLRSAGNTTNAKAPASVHRDNSRSSAGAGRLATASVILAAGSGSWGRPATD